MQDYITKIQTLFLPGKTQSTNVASHTIGALIAGVIHYYNLLDTSCNECAKKAQELEPGINEPSSPTLSLGYVFQHMQAAVAVAHMVAPLLGDEVS